MSNSPLVSYTKISKCKNVRKSKIDTITIHCFVGQVSVERMGKSFSSAASTCSCNYGIGSDGRIGMYVEETHRAWTSSNKTNDHRAITIECASNSKHPFEINDKVYDSLIKLCADICQRNGIKELKWKADKTLIGKPEKQNMTVHRWFANKSCPGQYIYDRLGQIAADVNALMGVEPAIEPEVDELEEALNYDYVLKSFIEDVQEACGANVDGIAGPETIGKTITVSANINRKHPVVKAIQKRLTALGYTEVGAIDGIAGKKFTKAVKNYQKDHCWVVDGEITAGKTTWRRLLDMK